MEALNKTGLLNFVAMVTNKGWVNGNTGGGWKAAVAKILDDVEADADVRKIDVDMEIRRFNNRHPGDLSPDSLATYSKRVKTAIANYVRWVEDPQKYRPPARSVSVNGASRKAPDKAKKPESDVTDVTVVEPLPSPSPSPQRQEVFLATEANLALPFPLRPGYLAQVVIPRDMTKAEAARLCAFISTLAVDN